jgi:hypothetical protein
MSGEPKERMPFSFISRNWQGILGKEKSGNNGYNADVAALVENRGVEPLTSCMPCKRSTN